MLTGNPNQDAEFHHLPGLDAFAQEKNVFEVETCTLSLCIYIWHIILYYYIATLLDTNILHVYIYIYRV